MTLCVLNDSLCVLRVSMSTETHVGHINKDNSVHTGSLSIDLERSLHLWATVVSTKIWCDVIKTLPTGKQ